MDQTRLDRLEVLHGDSAQWIRRRGGTVPTRRLDPWQRKEIRDCFKAIDTDGSGTYH